MNQLANVEHYVYRLYDNQDRLIYVGCSYKPIQRIKWHKRNMWWAPQIHRTDITIHENRKAGLAAEAEARTVEGPRWNIESRWMQRYTWTIQQTRDYITALENHPTHKTPLYQQKIDRAKQHLKLLANGYISPMKIQTPSTGTRTRRSIYVEAA